jgi:hypothetical protein
LDLYRGQFDFATFSTQIHDFDPGIHPYPGGLFWTETGVSLSNVELGTGRARMTATDLPVTDFGNIPNALFRFAPSFDAKCGFDIHWNGPVSSRGAVSTTGSSGELVMTNATMTWSGSNASGFKFVSNPAGQSSFFAQLGRVQNGVFFEG